MKRRPFPNFLRRKQPDIDAMLTKWVADLAIVADEAERNTAKYAKGYPIPAKLAEAAVVQLRRTERAHTEAIRLIKAKAV